MSCATERACTCPTCAGLVEASSPESYRLRRSADRALHATGTGGVLEFAARTLDLYATHAPRDLNPQVGHWLRVWTRAAIEGAPLARGGSCGPRAGPALRRPWPPRLPQLGAPAKEISILATSDGGQGGEHSPKDCENCARRGKWVPTGPGWKPPTTPGASGPEQPKPTGDVSPGPDTERDPVVTGGPSYKVYQCVLFSWTETIPVGKECLYQIMKSKMWICLMVSGKCDRKWTFTLWGGRGGPLDQGSRSRDAWGRAEASRCSPWRLYRRSSGRGGWARLRPTRRVGKSSAQRSERIPPVDALF